MKLSEILAHVEALVREEWGNVAPGNEPEGLSPARQPVPGAPATDKIHELKKLYQECAQCTLCPLYATARNLVFADGDPNPGFVVVGEAPGADEDAQGLPFVGRSGQLLRKTLAEAGMPPASVFICNILKHRPPDNRNPLPAEIEACTPHLMKQLQIVRPKIILTLGNFSTKFLLATERGITQMRGRTHESPLGWTVFPTFHPSAVLRNPVENTPVFREDIARAVEYFRSLP